VEAPDQSHLTERAAIVDNFGHLPLDMLYASVYYSGMDDSRKRGNEMTKFETQILRASRSGEGGGFQVNIKADGVSVVASPIFRTRRQSLDWAAETISSLRNR